MSPVGRVSYNTVSGERGEDAFLYNSQADAGSDDAAFDPQADNEAFHPVGARGAGNQPTGRNWESEDKETASSDHTGRIPRGRFLSMVNRACF